MKKLLLILILLLSINVYASDLCYIEEDGDCILDSLIDYTFDDKTGSIIYDNTNKTVTINNYEGTGIGLYNFDDTISVIFEGNNKLYSGTYNYNAGLYISDEDFNVIIEGKNNSSITFNNVNYGIYANYDYSNNENRKVEIKKLNINGSNINNIIYFNNNIINIHDCNINVDSSNEEVLKIVNPIYSDNNINNINNNKFNAYDIGGLLFIQSYDKLSFNNNEIDFTGKENKYLFNAQGKSNKNQKVYIENNTIKGSKCLEVLLLNAQYGGTKSDIYIKNNSVDIDCINNIAFESRYYNVYLENNSKLEFTDLETGLSKITLCDTNSIIGDTIYVETRQSSTSNNIVHIESKVIYFENEDIEIKNNENNVKNSILYLARNDGSNGTTIIKDSKIKLINNKITGIHTMMTNLTIENSDIIIENCSKGFYVYKDLKVYNSSIKHNTNNPTNYGAGIEHYAEKGLLYVENSDVYIDISSINPINIYGIYTYAPETIEFKNSNLSIKIIINNPPADKSTKTSYGIYFSDTATSSINFIDSFVNICLDANSGQVYRGGQDKFTNNSTTYKMDQSLMFYTKNTVEAIMNKEYLDSLENYDDYIASSLLIDRDDYTYDIVNGNKQELNKNNIKEFSLKIDGNHMLFNELYINDNLFIKDTDYTITKGSTIITFTESGLNKLNNLNTGTYNIKATYSNGEEVLGDFKVINSINNPKTGDNLFIYIIISLITLIVFTYLCKTKKMFIKNI